MKLQIEFDLKKTAGPTLDGGDLTEAIEDQLGVEVWSDESCYVVEGVQLLEVSK